MALGNIIGRIGGAVKVARNAIQERGLPTPLQIATGALPGAAGVAASVVQAQIERKRRRRDDFVRQSVNQVSAIKALDNSNKAMGAPVLMAGAGNSNILNDLGQSVGAPAVQGTRATGLLEGLGVGGNVSFGTQSNNQPLIIIGGIIAAILIALGVKNSLGPKRRRR